MIQPARPEIVIEGAQTNNLKNVSLRIPHHQLIVVTGVSGSGKSSLVFDLIAKEAQRRYFETLPSFARQFMGKLSRPEADLIEGLSPVIAIGQQVSGTHVRSTVGTMSDLYDHLRLLFARCGQAPDDISLSRSLFSFNTEQGRCPRCLGIGQEEEIDLDKLIAFPEKTIREGALAPTLPTGYIMYSQVTIEVLNQVCQAEGFHVDIPWNELTEQQKEVILYGSQRIKVPFGKHSLESRLKWTGIKAKPREEGHYKGMIPIMSDILKRDRNANILKYVKSVTCPSCKGTRLNEAALSVRVHEQSIAEIAKMEIGKLHSWIQAKAWDPVGQEIIEKMVARTQVLADLGLSHLTVDRPASSLRSSEIQRLRVANQILVPLSNVLYIFDEPSIGLHRDENEQMVRYFKSLTNRGNTVIVVEHNLQTIKSADHIIEMGPGAGKQGGAVVFNGSLTAFYKCKAQEINSPTLKALTQAFPVKMSMDIGKNNKILRLRGCRSRNLKNIDIDIHLGKLNVVSGPSGSGKSSLVDGTLVKLLRSRLDKGNLREDEPIINSENLDALTNLAYVSHRPIGKTPRSNPATYLGISEHIRNLFANLPASKSKGFTKSRFSFNTKGGRCETCLGAGKIQLGMHFLGKVDLVCETCNGDRFNRETLAITYKGLSIADCYQLSVDEAITFFEGQQKILVGLEVLHEIGLGYLTLGQSSTTLSGGEAQRIKIANHLQRKDAGDTLFVIIEPTIGLHPKDVGSLLRLFDRITRNGNTLICVEQNEAIIAASEWHIALGPEGGHRGGNITYQGVPQTNPQNDDSAIVPTSRTRAPKHTVLTGVTTHGLKTIDVQIPHHQLTVVTGVSGSGKSSLVYDTLFAESNARFTESMTAYQRSFVQQQSEAKMKSFSGLGPAIALNRQKGTTSRRSTVGTLSGIHDSIRLLYSRLALVQGYAYTAQHFSFNHQLGACETCEGMGTILTSNVEEIIIDPSQPLLEGALSDNKALSYYADPHGQFIATLNEVARQKQWELDKPWSQLSKQVQSVILYGTGDEDWEVTWHFKTKTKSGTQVLNAKWLGFCTYIDQEYQRRLHNKNIEHLTALMHDVNCPKCDGNRLKPALLEVLFKDKHIAEFTKLDIRHAFQCLREGTESDAYSSTILDTILPGLLETLNTLIGIGLGHLSLDRPIRTLSGGEKQRVHLAGQLSSHLFGVTYVLDEPTIGLDEQQVSYLVNILKQIINNGNTVVVVEHDPEFIRSADYLIELGPGSGPQGGQVIYQGKKSALHKNHPGLTYALLNESAKNEIIKPGIGIKPFGLKGAIANNLKSIDVLFHSGQVTAITGISGSGKSSLIKDVLYNSWSKGRPMGCSSYFGMDQFEQVVLIDQEPPAQNRLSTPVQYLAILEKIQVLFAQSPEAKAAGLKKGDFSYQSKTGKCTSCNGNGQIKTSLDFMSDLWLTCDTCKGLRYSSKVLSYRYHDKHVGDVLNMTVQEGYSFLENQSIIDHLQVLITLGLGHLKLGQPFNTLSGGERQRLKLAKSMMEHKGNVLYLMDEPSTGLHNQDLLLLIKVFQSLIAQGDTIIFIEHNMKLIQSANHVFTLGPGSGDQGGKLVNQVKQPFLN